MRHDTVKKLKSCLKKKLSINEALIVIFLITGALSYGAPVKNIESKKFQSTAISRIFKEKESGITVEVYGKTEKEIEEKISNLVKHLKEKKPKYTSPIDIDSKTNKALEAEITREFTLNKIDIKDKKLFSEKIKKYHQEATKNNKPIDIKSYNKNGDIIIIKNLNSYYEANVLLMQKLYKSEYDITVGEYLKSNDKKRTLSPIVAAPILLASGAALSHELLNKNRSHNSSNPDEIKVWKDGIRQTELHYTSTDNFITTENNHGLRAVGSVSQIINKGEITVKPSGLISIPNINNGVIKTGTYATHSFGMVTGEGANGINKGKIILDNSLNPNVGGIYATDNSSSTNEGEISGNGKIGMYATNGSSITNELVGTISTNVGTGMSVEGAGATAINKGTISNKDDYGMSAVNGGTATNASGATISNAGENGMYATGTGATAINKGIISNKDDYGMVAINAGTVTNDIGATISNIGTSGMAAQGTDSIAINKGIISNLGEDGMAAEAGGTVINDTGATVSNSGSWGMDADTDSTAINRGTISNTGNYGMHAVGGGAVINDTSATVSNTQNYGMTAYGVDSTAINKGIISNLGNYGMSAVNGGTATNASGATISNTGDYGMYASGAGSTAVNNGRILNGGPNKGGSINGGTFTNNNPSNTRATPRVNSPHGGMEKANTTWFTADGIGSTTINNAEIGLNDRYSTGMLATNGGTIINKGTINLNADKGTGMSVATDSTAINEGIINLNSTNGVGIRVAGENATVQNNGSIFISGVESPTTVVGTADANGNKTIEIEKGASFINNGQFTHSGDLNSKTMGPGLFILAGGTVEAKSIRGDYKASGALAMGSYKDEYTTYQMFKTDNMYANIESNSVMFDAKLTNQDSNGFYGIDMYRKNFNEIVDSSNYANYLENNYTTTNNTEAKENLYDAYKLLTSAERLNQEVNETFGNTIYPTFIYQTLGMIRKNNEILKAEAFKPTNEEVRYIGYANYKDSDINMSGYVSDYDSKMSSISLGVDKAISNTTRIGLVGTLGKSDYNYDLNSDSRKDDFYQLNAIASYEKNNMKATATAYVGKSFGDIDRTLAINIVNEKMSGNLDNNYYGLDLSLEKRYYMAKINLTPRIELNTLNIKQESIKEKGEYALDVDSINSVSVESGIGVKIDRTFYMRKDYQLTPEFSLMYFKELSGPYESTDAVLTSVSSDKFKISSYDAGTNRGQFNLALGVEKNSLGAKLGVLYLLDEQGEEVTPYVSVNYTF